MKSAKHQLCKIEFAAFKFYVKKYFTLFMLLLDKGLKGPMSFNLRIKPSEIEIWI